jgi:WD40 repeat protein
MELFDTDSRQYGTDFSVHQGMIVKMCNLPWCDAYACAGRDGLVSMWSTDMTHIKTIATAPRFARRAWITDLSYLPRSKCLVASSMDNKIRLFDPNRAKEELVGVFHKLSRLPMCVDCQLVGMEELLTFGDQSGFVNLKVLTTNWHTCDGMFDCHDRPTTENIRSWSRSLHTNWVTRAIYNADLVMMTSCSLDGSLVCYDLDADKTKWSTVVNPRGVLYMDWSKRCSPPSPPSLMRAASTPSPPARSRGRRCCGRRTQTSPSVG